MNRFIDYFALRIALFFLIFVICQLIFEKLSVSLSVCILVFFAAVLIMEILRKDKNESKCPYNSFVRYFALEGNNALKEKIKDYISPMEITEEGSDFLIIQNGNEKECIYFAFRFSSLSQEDIAKCYRVCKEREIKKGYILGKDTVRTTLSLAGELNLNINFISAKQLYRCLKNKNLLPVTATKTKIKRKGKIKFFLSVFFSKNNVKHFLFGGIILALMSLITPLKVYYLSVAAITLAFSLICLFAPGEITGSKGLFHIKRKKEKNGNDSSSD